jgi:hypothetical protein
MIFTEHANIFPAMIKARAAVSEIVKDSKGNYGRYADLATINAAIQPALGANGLAIVQEVSTDPVPNGLLVTVETWLCHSSGEYIQFTPLVLPVSKPDAQGVGSAITYGRRYTLMAALNLSADDDDGQAAVGKPTTQHRQPLSSEKNAPEPPPSNGNGKVVAEDPADMLEWAANAHASSEGPASARMYGYLASQIDGITEAGAHNTILGAMVHREVSSENPVGYALASQLLTWIVKEKGKGEEKQPNPDYNPAKVATIQALWAQQKAMTK